MGISFLPLEAGIAGKYDICLTSDFIYIYFRYLNINHAGTSAVDAGSVAVAANPGPLLNQGPLLGWDLGHLLGLDLGHLLDLLDQGHLEVRKNPDTLAGNILNCLHMYDICILILYAIN